MSNAFDAGQYSMQEIAKYELIYGQDFISPGGLATAQEFTAMLALQPGLTVLDIGCGLGGSAFYMAQQYGVQVHGLDLSANMLSLARVRCQTLGLTKQVSLTQADILAFAPTATYDRVYSRDVFLHIHDKTRLFQAIYQCLKPGGRLLFTDYCCGAAEKSPDFMAYVQQRNYALCTVAEYARLLGKAGFAVTVAEDRTPQFIQLLQQESDHLPVEQMDVQTVADLRHSWQAKLLRAQQGEQRWGLFIAQKP